MTNWNAGSGIARRNSSGCIEEFKAHEEQFRLMIEGVKDHAIFTLDPEGRVTSWNKGAEHIYGYAPDEIIGQHRSRFFTPEDVASGLPMWELREAVATGRFSEEGVAGPRRTAHGFGPTGR